VHPRVGTGGEEKLKPVPSPSEYLESLSFLQRFKMSFRSSFSLPAIPSTASTATAAATSRGGHVSVVRSLLRRPAATVVATTTAVAPSRKHAPVGHVWRDEDRPNMRDIRIHFYTSAEEHIDTLYVLQHLLERLVTGGRSGVTYDDHTMQLRFMLEAPLVSLLKQKCIEKELGLKWVHFD
jgi:hypothetical protein